MDDSIADYRNPPGDGCPDADAPISIGVEPHHLTAESQPESHDQKDTSRYPGEFTRVFIGTPEKHLGHVAHHHDDHHRRSPVMHTSHYPAERLSIIEQHQAMISFSRRWHIGHRQENAGDDLDDEAGQRHTTERVKPAFGALGNRMPGGLFKKFDQMQPALEPQGNVS